MCVLIQRREFEEDTLEVLEAFPGFMKSQEVQDSDPDPKRQVNKLICMNTSGSLWRFYYFLHFKGAILDLKKKKKNSNYLLLEQRT